MLLNMKTVPQVDLFIINPYLNYQKKNQLISF